MRKWQGHDGIIHARRRQKAAASPVELPATSGKWHGAFWRKGVFALIAAVVMQYTGLAEVTGREPPTYGRMGAPMPSGRRVSALRLFVPVHYPDYMIFPPLVFLDYDKPWHFVVIENALRLVVLVWLAALCREMGDVFYPIVRKITLQKMGKTRQGQYFLALTGFLVLKLLPDYPISSSGGRRPAQRPDFTQSRRRTASSHRPPCRCRLFQNSPPEPWPRPATGRRGAWGQGGCSSPRGAAGRAVR